jgi:hypothetical protein
MSKGIQGLPKPGEPERRGGVCCGDNLRQKSGPINGTWSRTHRRAQLTIRQSHALDNGIGSSQCYLPPSLMPAGNMRDTRLPSPPPLTVALGKRPRRISWKLLATVACSCAANSCPKAPGVMCADTALAGPALARPSPRWPKRPISAEDNGGVEAKADGNGGGNCGGVRAGLDDSGSSGCGCCAAASRCSARRLRMAATAVRRRKH